MCVEVVSVWLRERTAEASRIEALPYATPHPHRKLPHALLQHSRGAQAPFSGSIPDAPDGEQDWGVQETKDKEPQ